MSRTFDFVANTLCECCFAEVEEEEEEEEAKPSQEPSESARAQISKIYKLLLNIYIILYNTHTHTSNS